MGGLIPWMLLILWIVAPIIESRGAGDSHEEEIGELFTLEGKVELWSVNSTAWISQTRVLVDGGKYQGFIRTDGQFTVHGLPRGDYVVEVTNPLYEFSPARVQIFRNGKKRASELNLVQPNHIRQIKYPLQFKECRKHRFFEKRSSLKLEDIIYNPMVITVLLPLLGLLMFPNMLNQSLLNPQVQQQFKRQLSTMTGGRGGVIGMGLDEGGGGQAQEEEEEVVEGETTEENAEKKKKKKKRKAPKEKEEPLLPMFSFDLAEWLANYFYEGDKKTQTPSTTPFTDRPKSKVRHEKSFNKRMIRRR